MSLVRCGRGLFGGPLGDLAVVGGRCLGGAGFALWVSGPFPFATSSLFDSATPAELQPLFHPWAGSSQCGVRPGGQGGDRTSSSYARLLQPSLCDSKGHRWVAPGDRPLPPQQVCGCLPFSYGDNTICSPMFQGRGLDGVSGSPGHLPPGSSTSIFSPVPEVLRGGVDFPVSRPLFWPVDGSSSIHPRHGPGLCDHASSRVPDSPVPRRLAGPCFHLPGDCAGEGFSTLAMSPTGDSCQSPKELVGSQPDSGLLRDDNSDFSFEGFPDSQMGSEVVSTPSGFSFHTRSPGVDLASTVGSNVICLLWFWVPGSA